MSEACSSRGTISASSLCWQRALEQAHRLDKLRPVERSPLCGLPCSIKDLMPEAGVRTTYGSIIFKDNIPEKSDSLVTHLETSGAVISGKTNSPEFGAGGNTFNDVFGVTRNPWNLEKSAGGSSGGAAASLAAGTSWLATGSDNAGSLRTPAAFCGVVGLRPTPHLVAAGPGKNPFDDIAVQGPMARNVRDAALFLDVLVRPGSVSPFYSDTSAGSYLKFANEPSNQVRVAFSADLGLNSVNPDVAAVVTSAMVKLQSGGFSVHETDLNLQSMDSAYQVFRALNFAANLGGHLKNHPDILKPEIVINIKKGMALSSVQVTTAMQVRTQSYFRLLQALENVDVIVCPASTAKPFDVTLRYPGEEKGLGYEHYLQWLDITYVLSALAIPVISIPCGMSNDGLPVGIQIIGKPHGEGALLSVASAVEETLGPWWTREQQLETVLRDAPTN